MRKLKKTIEEVKNTYVINVNDVKRDNISNDDIKFNINDQLFLETLLMIIRGNTIKYSSIKKKKKIEEEKKLEEEINILENKINNDFINTEAETIQVLEQKKVRLVEIRKEKIEGVMLRSKCRYQDLGEKPTHYFFSLENRNYTSKVINKIIEDNGTEYTETKDILNSQKRFYEQLYEENNELDDRPIESVIGENNNKLLNIEAEKLEGKILYTELAQALKHMKNEKSPGQDGFTVEFFLFFLD